MWSVCVDAKLQCNICMEDFELDESVRTLPCKHFYHPVCISTWLQLVSALPLMAGDTYKITTQKLDAFIWPHRTTTYVDAACCYRPSNVVCLSRLSALKKTADLSRCHLGCGFGWARGTVYKMGVKIPLRSGSFEREGAAHCKI